MVEVGIIRDPTKEELQGDEGFNPIVITKGNVETAQDKHSKEVETEAQKYSKLKKPFCRKCAYMDFKEFKQRILMAERSGSGYADFKKLGIKLPKLEEYGKEDRFEKVDEGETKNPGRWKGDPITFDKWIKYKCKVRGCNITIFQ